MVHRRDASASDSRPHPSPDHLVYSHRHNNLQHVLLLSLHQSMSTCVLLLDPVYRCNGEMHQSSDHSQRNIRLLSTHLRWRLDPGHPSFLPRLEITDGEETEISRRVDSSYGRSVSTLLVSNIYRRDFLETHLHLTTTNHFPTQSLNSNNNPHPLPPLSLQQRRLPLRHRRRRNLVSVRNWNRHHRRLSRNPPPTLPTIQLPQRHQRTQWLRSTLYRPPPSRSKWSSSITQPLALGRQRRVRAQPQPRNGFCWWRCGGGTRTAAFG